MQKQVEQIHQHVPQNTKKIVEIAIQRVTSQHQNFQKLQQHVQQPQQIQKQNTQKQNFQKPQQQKQNNQPKQNFQQKKPLQVQQQQKPQQQKQQPRYQQNNQPKHQNFPQGAISIREEIRRMIREELAKQKK